MRLSIERIDQCGGPRTDVHHANDEALSKVAGLLIACVVAMLVATPAPALALTPGTQAEWSSFPELRKGRYTGSDLVRFWQLIVWADGTTGTSSCTSFADGQFGSNTEAQTRTWQSRHGVGVDGQVGPQTWGKAKSRLHAIPGESHVTDLTRNGTGTKVYSFYYNYDGEGRSRFPCRLGMDRSFHQRLLDPHGLRPVGVPLLRSRTWRYVSW